MMQVTDDAIARAIEGVAGRHGPNRSFCPTEAARVLAEDWRPLLGPVRRVAADLARAGRIEILRHGRPVTPEAMRGVVRLRARA